MSDDKNTLVTSSTNNIFNVAVEKLSKANPADVQQVAASQIALLRSYHVEVLDQAKKSFRWAIIAAGVGLVFLVSAIVFLIYNHSTEIAIASTISGILIEFISAINFFLYGKTASQMADFQQRLDITQRYLLANSMCESLTGDTKNKTRSDIIKSIVGLKDGLVVQSDIKKDPSQ